MNRILSPKEAGWIKLSGKKQRNCVRPIIVYQ
jgi:hypothetical protein